MAHFEKKLSENTVFTGRVFSVSVDKVLLENGKTGEREVLHHHGGACIAALTPENEIYMIRQFRYAMGQELWELPAGKLEPGEAPEKAAHRELAEECGLMAGTMRDIGPMYPSVGYDSEIIYCYLAQNLTPCEMHLDEDEFLTPVKMPLKDAVDLVMNGQVPDSKTSTCLLKLWYLQQNGML